MRSRQHASYPAGPSTKTRASTPACAPSAWPTSSARTRVKENILIAIEAARSRGEALDHVLLYGPPGLGKTSLAQIIANELGVNIKTSSGPLLERKGDLTAILTSLEPREVFFLDEIHRLMPAIEEILYPAMEDYRIDLVIGQGPGARIHPFQLNRFTLVGATTRAGLITAPLRSRFGIVHRLEFYQPEDLVEILAPLGDDPEHSPSKRTAPTKSPGAAAARRAWPIACCAACAISPRCARRAASPATWRARRSTGSASTQHGLDEVDRNLMLTIIQKFSGGPVGLNTIAASLSEEEDAIEEIYEPYLMQMGLLGPHAARPRGHSAGLQAFRHRGASPAATPVLADVARRRAAAHGRRKARLHCAGIEPRRPRGDARRAVEAMEAAAFASCGNPRFMPPSRWMRRRRPGS